MAKTIASSTSSGPSAPASERRRVKRPSTAFAGLSLFVIVLATSFTGCPCLKAATDFSPSLRWWLFSNFGAQRVCPEMLKTSMPLRLDDNAPAMGRFFPAQCSYAVNDDSKTLTVNIQGTGYGYMAPAKRVSFSLATAVEYRPDFVLTGDDMYLWGKPNRIVQGPDFRILAIENPVVNIAANIPPWGNIANFLGNQVVTAFMTRGFTVIANDDTGNDFALGILHPPARPPHPFSLVGNERLTFANETTDVYANQRDFLGPFEVAKSGQKLYGTLTLQGAAVDVMVVSKTTGDLWRQAYQAGQVGPPPGQVFAGEPLMPSMQLQRAWSLPPGSYYIVIDNTSSAGTVSPPMSVPLLPVPDPLSRVSYVAQLGD